MCILEYLGSTASSRKNMQTYVTILNSTHDLNTYENVFKVCIKLQKFNFLDNYIFYLFNDLIRLFDEVLKDWQHINWGNFFSTKYSTMQQFRH